MSRSIRRNEICLARRRSHFSIEEGKKDSKKMNACFFLASSLRHSLHDAMQLFFWQKNRRKEGDHFLRYAAHLETKEEEKMLQNVASISSGEGRIRGWLSARVGIRSELGAINI